MEHDEYPQTLLELLRYRASLQPDDLALADPLGNMTYGELLSRVEAAEQVLHASELRFDSPVALVSRSGPVIARLFLDIGCHAVVVPIDPSSNADDVADLFRRVRVQALVADVDDTQSAREAARRTGVPVLEVRDGQWVTPVSRGATLDQDRRTPGAQDTLHILSSSGTTGRPKLVPRTHGSAIGSAFFHTRNHGIAGRETALCPVPMFHGLGLIALLTALAGGRAVVCLGRFDLAEFAHWAQRMCATQYVGPPPVHSELLRALEQSPDALGGWRPLMVTSASAALPPLVYEGLVARFGASVTVGYGMTEAAPITVIDLGSEPARRGAVGKPLMLDLRIVDAQGAELPAGSVGEITVRGVEVFEGYLDDPALNAASFVDGWFRTGDLGRLDDEGYLYLTGRATTVINRGGSKVSPDEIEQWLLSRPGIRHAVVFGVAHPSLGEDVVAVLVVEPDAQVDVRALRRTMLDSMPGYKVPSRIVAVDCLPLGPAGKVRREGLADSLRDALAPVHRSASTDLERLVSGVMSEMLDGVGVGMDDNFFALGGYSLLATRMLAKLETMTGRRIAPAEFIRDPSASGLVALLERGQGECAHPAIEPYRTSGVELPLFWIPGFNGSSQVVRMVLPFVSGKIPVYGIRTPDALDVDKATIEEIAAFCVERIREVQPQGPYRIAGYSIGGVLAHAIACRLEAIGERIELLFLVDADAALHRSPPWPSGARGRIESAIAGRPFRIFGGRVVLVRSWGQLALEMMLPALGWEHLARGGVALHDIPTTHLGLMLQPHVARVGLALEGWLSVQSPDGSPGAHLRPDAEVPYQPLPARYLEARACLHDGQPGRALEVLRQVPDGSVPAWVVDQFTKIERAGDSRDGSNALNAELMSKVSAATRETPMTVVRDIRLGEFDRARRLLDAPMQPGEREETRQVFRMSVAWRSGDREGATRELVRLVQLIGGRFDLLVPVFEGLAAAYWLEPAGRVMRQLRAAASGPALAQVLLHQCKMSIRIGEWEKAVRLGTEAVEVAPDLDFCRVWLIRALVGHGQEEEARRYYREALERFSGRGGYQEALDEALGSAVKT